MSLLHGSLFSGYGGIDLALAAALGARTAWVADIDKGACKVLAHRFADVPNLGDVASVNWADIPRVDVLSGGTPCQDLSHAGKRAGMTEGTRSNLWVAMRETIAHLRPPIVVWENVRGAYSAPADSDLERDARLLGDGTVGPYLRALGRVLGDLATLGYDAQWFGLHAADVGAPHLRFRVFVLAWERSSTDVLLDARHDARRAERAVQPDARAGAPDGAGQPGARTGRRDVRQHDEESEEPAGAALLPTPAVNDMGDGKSLEWWDEWAPRQQASDGTPAPHGRSLAIEAQRLMPTPTAWEQRSDPDVDDRNLLPLAVERMQRAQHLPTPTTSDHRGSKDAPGRTGGPSLSGAIASHTLPTPTSQAAKHNDDDRGPDTLDDYNLWSIVGRSEQWGAYADAIAHWESLTRPAPPPTEPYKDRARLSPMFTEWLMGLPAGWITDVPGITRAQALALAGNGVLPQQCAAAIAHMADLIEKEMSST